MVVSAFVMPPLARRAVVMQQVLVSPTLQTKHVVSVGRPVSIVAKDANVSLANVSVTRLHALMDAVMPAASAKQVRAIPLVVRVAWLARRAQQAKDATPTHRFVVVAPTLVPTVAATVLVDVPPRPRKLVVRVVRLVSLAPQTSPMFVRMDSADADRDQLVRQDNVVAADSASVTQPHVPMDVVMAILV